MLNNQVVTSDKVIPLDDVPSVAILTMSGGGLDLLDEYVIGGGTFAARWIVPESIDNYLYVINQLRSSKK